MTVAAAPSECAITACTGPTLRPSRSSASAIARTFVRAPEDDPWAGKSGAAT